MVIVTSGLQVASADIMSVTEKMILIGPVWYTYQSWINHSSLVFDHLMHQPWSFMVM